MQSTSAVVTANEKPLMKLVTLQRLPGKEMQTACAFLIYLTISCCFSVCGCSDTSYIGLSEVLIL
jgi:hypothetical protein